MGQGMVPGHGGGPALAWPVATPNMLLFKSSVRTSTVSLPPSVQLVIFAPCRPATSAATEHGTPWLIPRSASAAASAARSAAAAALDAITADWASNSINAMASITTMPSPAARTVPDPRSWPCSGSPACAPPGSGFPCSPFPGFGFPCSPFPGSGFPGCGAPATFTRPQLRDAAPGRARSVPVRSTSPTDGLARTPRFRSWPKPGRTTSTG